MIRLCFLSIVIVTGLAGCAVGSVSTAEERVDEQGTQVAEDPAALIDQAMRDRWRHAPRRWWTVEFGNVEGIEDPRIGSLVGTPWWVRVFPPNWEFEPGVRYEIDAAAVDQGYGVINFYVYWIRYAQE